METNRCPTRRVAAIVKPGASATPTAGTALIHRASRSSWSTTPGQAVTAHSAIDGPATHQAGPGRAVSATSTSAIAASATGKFTSTSARDKPPDSPSRDTW